MNEQNGIHRPSLEMARIFIEKWNEEKYSRYITYENAMKKLCGEFLPHNTSLEDVLLKVSTINSFYSTRIINIYKIAEYVHSLNIDSLMAEGDYDLVNQIADTKPLIKRRSYSFATKYCSHHYPELYPIYDSFVVRILVHFQEEDNFYDFDKDQLRGYPFFCEVIKEFQSFYDLNELTFKELDMYIWMLCKESSLPPLPYQGPDAAAETIVSIKL